MAVSEKDKNKDKMKDKGRDISPAEEEPKKKKGWKLPVAFFFCFVISVGASSGITFFLVSSNSKQADSTQDKDVNKELEAFQKTLNDQNLKIQAMKEENDILKLYLRHSSATALKNILINQEENIQAFLKVLKASMNDLTKLTQGTADWNEQYQYQLDLALKGSLEREDLLKMLKTGEPNEKSQ